MDHVEVVECALSATRNCLKLQAAKKLFSPYSNIRAVTSKLCPHSKSAPVENHPVVKSRTAAKSP